MKMTISGPRLTTVAIRQHYLPRRFLMTPAQCDISRKLRIFNYAKQIGNVSAACRHFDISREIYYRWKRAYETASPSFFRGVRGGGAKGG
jgi:Helix-turn-helix domain